jgi:hypothetical protein
LEAEVEAAKVEAVEVEAACIRGIGIYRKSTEVDRAHRADRADGTDGTDGEYKVLEAGKIVRTCQSSLGQNGTYLGLLLLHVGPNGDRFGGQAFMEHYNALRNPG